MSSTQTLIMTADEVQRALAVRKQGAVESADSRRIRRELKAKEKLSERIPLLAVLADSLTDDGCYTAASRTREEMLRSIAQLDIIRTGADALKPKVRTLIRETAEGKASGSRCPIKIVRGDSPPRADGETGHAEFKGGGACRNYIGARRAGYKVRYVASTLTVTVGAGWLLAHVKGVK